MEAKRTATALVLFLCTAFVLWWVATSYDFTARSSSASASSYMVVIHHSLRNNAHVYTGAIESTTCQTLSSGVDTQGSGPMHLTVHLTRIESPNCSATMKTGETEEPFLIAIETGEGAPRIEKAILDGREVSFTVLEE